MIWSAPVYRLPAGLYSPGMFRLTREVRLSVNLPANWLPACEPASGTGARRASLMLPCCLSLQVTLGGAPEASSGFLCDIHDIDRAVKQKVACGNFWPSDVFAALCDAWPGKNLQSITLWLSPFLSLTQLCGESGMYLRISRKFEFAAAHRLYNPALSDEENRRIFGKCSHPSGHGHNYELQVTLRGRPDADTLLASQTEFERIVTEHVLEPFDHKNLNIDVPEFSELRPTVENIAMVIYRRLKDRFAGIGAELASVTVWETPRTWCEYSE